MALVLILVILVIWIGVIGSLFASVVPFVDTLGSATNYTMAYYSAQMSLERWLLALKYHDAWFEGQSGFGTWNTSDSKNNTDIWKLTKDANSDSYWTIHSRVSSIPSSWNGNIELLLATGDSVNYNSLTYNEWLELPLYLDNDSDPIDYYTNSNVTTNISPINGWSPYTLQWRFRLPPKVKWTFKENDIGDTSSDLDNLTDIDDDQIYDDIILARWYKWYDTLLWESFSLSPTVKQDFNTHMPVYDYDNSIRESAINAGDSTDNINTNAGGSQWFSILNWGVPLPDGSLYNGGSSLTGFNILPLGNVRSDPPVPFNWFLQEPTIWGDLTFSISNRMQDPKWDYYPFLERQMKACADGSSSCDLIMPDRFYSIEWVWSMGSYTVHMYLKKPVRKTTNWSSFTIIF